ncbi:LysR family transcriptional regulator [Roseinatronobacter sp. NSM]|uniref:LysR family transcriptional regulator n=1 Tax=Roseinatronobacter sp. NSM TaxID=3457785 RepID=UPI004035C4E1
MNIRSLQIFVKVIEEGTLAQASEKMNLSQSAASRLIQILEDEYQTKLFLRERKRLIPTRAGELFYPMAVRILSSIKAIPGLLSEARVDNGAPLRIICHPRLISGLIVPAMIRFAEHEPHVCLRLEVYPRRYLAQHILEDSFDIGVCNLPLPVRDVNVEVISNAQVHVLLPKEHPLATRDTLGPEDMTGSRYIALDESTLLRQLTDLEIVRQGQKLPVAHEVSSTTAAIGLVKAGLGFTLTDRGMVDRDLGGGLVQIPWRPRTTMRIGCFRSRKTEPHPLTGFFRDCLVEAGRSE